MPTLSWNEIEKRARLFSSKWEQAHDEKGESQSFWQGFFDIFGIDPKRQGAFFEYRAKKAGDKQGFMDVFWPGKILVEQKSLGKDLDAAIEQANNYLPNIEDELLPQMVVACDFKRFICLDRVTNERHEFTLDQLHNHVKNFGFLIGRSDLRIAEEDPVNRKAAEAMAALHNALRDANYDGHDLEVLLVRLVFCLFADDSGIFEHGTFERYLTERTSPDGSDTGPRINMIFQTLDTLEDERQTTLDDEIVSLPYINGGLFKDTIRTPNFNSEMRTQLLEAMQLDWAKVSPAIFGSMFQGVMDPEARRNLGAHYTSEKNIFKVIDSLFLDELKEELSKLKPNQKKKLNEFHDKLASLKFLDPACGCGNFLVITYRELRKLEHETIQKMRKVENQLEILDIKERIKVNVDQMYGIEIEEFPALIAETALWLTDHQMNMEASKLFGQHFVRLPLTKRANIVNDNALRMDWKEVVDPSELNYILGNPPFNGSRTMDKTQKEDLRSVAGKSKQVGLLDFVAGWYFKATEFVTQNNSISTAFVSTNSITQGEQVSILWKPLLAKGIGINFAHRTFKWSNDAKGVAAVYCVIIGIAIKSERQLHLFDYMDIKGEPILIKPKNINPYLVDAPNVYVQAMQEPICQVPPMSFGNMPADGGELLFTDEEYLEFISNEPESEKFFRPLISAKEFLHNKKRWCLWLKDVEPVALKQAPNVLERVENVRNIRMVSSRPQLADTPTLFAQITQKLESPFLLIPRHSSENRNYIPIVFFDVNAIAHDSCMIISDATRYNFGILTSNMHMAWVRYTCGRLKSDYRYSKDIVYNNYPWPSDATDDQKQKVEELSQSILDARDQFPDSSLADLYDPRTMPPALSKAHKALDQYVDSLYRKKPFNDDAERVAHLFEMYAKLTENKS